MKNEKALQSLLTISNDTTIRVYRMRYGVEHVIMIEGNDRSEDSQFAVVANEKNGWEDYVDVEHAEKQDAIGDTYTEWRNGDF